LKKRKRKEIQKTKQKKMKAIATKKMMMKRMMCISMYIPPCYCQKRTT